MRKTTIGIDLGGTNIHTLVVNERGRILGRDHSPSESGAGAARVMDNVAASARHAARQARLKLSCIRCVGISTPGPVDHKRGIVTEATNFKGWRNVRLRDGMRKRLARRVIVENDANAAAFGENWLGAGRGFKSMVLVTLGTGIGGGIILEGKIWRGCAGAAGEIGHHTIRHDGIPCACGNRGCFERYGAAEGLVRLTREALAKGAKSLLGAQFSAKDVHTAARKGDKVARAAMDAYGRLLGAGLANVANILNPQVIVLTGGIANAGRMILEPARRELKSRALAVPARTCKLLRAKLYEDAGALGAARLALID